MLWIVLIKNFWGFVAESALSSFEGYIIALFENMCACVPLNVECPLKGRRIIASDRSERFLGWALISFETCLSTVINLFGEPSRNVEGRRLFLTFYANFYGGFWSWIWRAAMRDCFFVINFGQIWVAGLFQIKWGRQTGMAEVVIGIWCWIMVQPF